MKKAKSTEPPPFFDGWEPLGPPPEVPPPEAQWVLPPSPMRRGDSTLRKMRREMGTCLACFHKRAGPEVRFGNLYCARHIEMNQKRWEYLREQAIAKRAEWEKKAKSAGAGR